MSGLTTEQPVDTQKTGVDTSFGILNKAIEGIDRLAELNVQAVKSILAKNQEFIIKVFFGRKSSGNVFTAVDPGATCR